jgi:hypothetical protein
MASKKQTKVGDSPAEEVLAGELATLPETLTVTLEKDYWWVPDGQTDHVTYGPGEVEIPYAMAEGLVRAGVLNARVLPAPIADAATLAVAEPSGNTPTLSELLELVESLTARLEVVEEVLRSLPEAAIIGALNALGSDSDSSDTEEEGA